MTLKRSGFCFFVLLFTVLFIATSAQAKAYYPMVTKTARQNLQMVYQSAVEQDKDGALLAAMNHKMGVNLSSLDDMFSHIYNMIQSGNAKVVSCGVVARGGQITTGFYSKNGNPVGAWSRSCYGGELILLMKDTYGDFVPVLSFFCGNIIDPGTVVSVFRVIAQREEVECYTPQRILRF